jgi:hypothetical protein
MVDGLVFKVLVDKLSILPTNRKPEQEGTPQPHAIEGNAPPRLKKYPFFSFRTIALMWNPFLPKLSFVYVT